MRNIAGSPESKSPGNCLRSRSSRRAALPFLGRLRQKRSSRSDRPKAQTHFGNIRARLLIHRYLATAFASVGGSPTLESQPLELTVRPPSSSAKDGSSPDIDTCDVGGRLALQNHSVLFITHLDHPARRGTSLIILGSVKSPAYGDGSCCKPPTGHLGGLSASVAAKR
jgi:hypothetical protein